jgi:hypothetical protein
MKMDRTAFKIQSFESAADQTEYWLSKSLAERFAAAWYLTCQAYQLPYHADHKVDRTVFSMKKRAE